MSAEKVKRAEAIPFIFLFAGDGKRKAQRAADNPKTPPELRAELKRYLADPAAAAAHDQQQLLDRAHREADEALARAAVFAPDNRTNKPGPETLHIREIVAAHPEVARKPTKLRELYADEKILGGMGKGTFGNRVRDACRFHGIGKP